MLLTSLVPPPPEVGNNPGSTFVMLALGSAVVIHFLMLILIRIYGKGGEGTIGDIRTAIGRALPVPMGIAIWVIALTISIQYLIDILDWNRTVMTLSGEDEVIDLITVIGMSRTALVILLCTWFVSRALRAFSDILNKWHTRKESVELDTTAIQALASIGIVLVWVLGIVVTLQALGMNMNAVLTVGGIGGAAFAFASKDVIANFFGGLLIMFTRPFRVGDKIESGSKIAGTVTRVGLYATWLRTEDGKMLYVPNSIYNSNEIRKVTDKKD